MYLGTWVPAEPRIRTGSQRVPLCASGQRGQAFYCGINELADCQQMDKPISAEDASFPTTNNQRQDRGGKHRRRSVGCTCLVILPPKRPSRRETCSSQNRGHRTWVSRQSRCRQRRRSRHRWRPSKFDLNVVKAFSRQVGAGDAAASGAGGVRRRLNLVTNFSRLRVCIAG